MMKVLGYVLSFYLVLLAAVPCCAFDDCAGDKTEQTTDHKKGDGDCGGCSPFFNCQGCAAAVINCDTPLFNHTILYTQAEYSGFIPPSLSQANHDFWQPPRLG